MAKSRTRKKRSTSSSSSDNGGGDSAATATAEPDEESKESKEAANSSARKITDSLQHLGESLKTLSANADELMIAEQQATKRQRLDPPADAAGLDSAAPAAPSFH